MNIEPVEKQFSMRAFLRRFGFKLDDLTDGMYITFYTRFLLHWKDLHHCKDHKEIADILEIQMQRRLSALEKQFKVLVKAIREDVDQETYYQMMIDEAC